MADSTEPIISVALPRSVWKALLDAVPVSKETYTGPGEEVFAAVQAISHAVEPPHDG